MAASSSATGTGSDHLASNSRPFHGSIVVEIGAIDSIGIQLDAPYGLLLNLLPNLPADVERRPLKGRKASRGEEHQHEEKESRDSRHAVADVPDQH